MSATLQPRTAEDLREIIQAALADRTPLEICGRATKRGFGRPVEADRSVGLEKLSGIELYEPEELVMSARVGTPLAEIERVLADNQQELAFEPADYGAILGAPPGQGTIGGVIAGNLSGPRRLKAGAARDHFLGLEAVTGRGDLIKSGGRVMKNVTGYDLAKLLAGSFGTLAAMTRVTFKVLPAAETTATLVLGGLDPAAGMAALRRAVASPYDIAGAAYLPVEAAGRSGAGRTAGAGRALTLLRLEGTAPSVDYRIARLHDLLGTSEAELETLEEEHSRMLWREIRDVRLLPQERLLWRLSVPPATSPELITTLGSNLDLLWLADWAGGLLWLAVPDAAAAGPIRDALSGSGGHATLIRAPEEVRLEVPPFQPEAPALRALSARVKHSFDPERILNRGRMFADV